MIVLVFVPYLINVANSGWLSNVNLPLLWFWLLGAQVILSIGYGYRRYLLIPHGLGVAIASQIIALLVAYPLSGWIGGKSYMEPIVLHLGDLLHIW